MEFPTGTLPYDIAQQRFLYRTEPQVHDPIEAMVHLAFPCDADPTTKAIALEFWLHGVVYVHKNDKVHVFPPEACRVRGDGVLFVNHNHHKYADGLGMSLTFEPGDYVQLVLDRSKCHTLPKLDEDGEPGTDVVPWMEEWLRASAELKAYLKAS
jgi:hypothetical protein